LTDDCLLAMIVTLAALSLQAHWYLSAVSGYSHLAFTVYLICGVGRARVTIKYNHYTKIWL